MLPVGMNLLQGRIRWLLQSGGHCMEDSGTNYVNVLVTGYDKVTVAVRWSFQG